MSRGRADRLSACLVQTDSTCHLRTPRRCASSIAPPKLPHRPGSAAFSGSSNDGLSSRSAPASPLPNLDHAQDDDEHDEVDDRRPTRDGKHEKEDGREEQQEASASRPVEQRSSSPIRHEELGRVDHEPRQDFVPYCSAPSAAMLRLAVRRQGARMGHVRISRDRGLPGSRRVVCAWPGRRSVAGVAVVAVALLCLASCAQPTSPAGTNDGGVAIASSAPPANAPVDVALIDTGGTNGPMSGRSVRRQRAGR